MSVRFVGELTSVVRDSAGPGGRGVLDRDQAAEGSLDLRPRPWGRQDPNWILVATSE
jgi:hypothetical protein